MDASSISDKEFAQLQQLLLRLTGIHLSPAKKPLLCGRLAKRLRQRALGSYAEYFALITSGEDPAELETAVNLLTTNETYFFREAQHFDVLRQRVLAQLRPGRTFRLWSAACSTGEEPYSLAMVLADALGVDGPWELVASDISTAVLAKARAAHYPMERAEHIPKDYLKRYCLKGVGSQAGTLLVDEALRRRVSFTQVNLNATLPALGEFDVIFLRNVLIYFEPPVKRQVVSRLAERLRPGGWLFIGHSETLNGITDQLHAEQPTVYRKTE